MSGPYERPTAMMGLGLSCAYGGSYHPPTNHGDRRVGPRCLLENNTKRFSKAPPEYHNMGNEFTAVLIALLAEGSFWLRQPLVVWRISTHALQRLVQRHMSPQTLAEIIEHGNAEDLSYRQGGWGTDMFGFPVFHGFQGFRMVLPGRGSIRIAFLGEGGLTNAGHVKHVLSISTVFTLPKVHERDFTPIRYEDGLRGLANQVLARHRAEAYKARIVAPVRNPLGEFYRRPEEGTAERDWVDRYDSRAAELVRFSPPAPRALGLLVTPLPPAIPAPPTRRVPLAPASVAPQPAQPPTERAPLRTAPVAHASPHPPTASATTPVPKAAPASATTGYLPPDPWLGTALVPSRSATVEDSIGFWM